MAITLTRRQWTFVAIQFVLLLIELATPYDIFSRRCGLGLTDVLGTLGILWVAKRAAHRGQVVSVWAYFGAAIGLWLDAVGNFWGLYTHFWWWDHVTHAVGVFGATAMAQYFWSPTLGSARSWLTVATGQTIGAWYEVSEYIGDWMFQMHRVGPGLDTSRDLWFNFVGGALAWLVLVIVDRRRKMV